MRLQPRARSRISWLGRSLGEAIIFDHEIVSFLDIGIFEVTRGQLSELLTGITGVKLVAQLTYSAEGKR
jgi:hypothetical protein